MSEIMRKSLDKQRKFSNKIIREQHKMRDYFICYIITAYEKLKDSEELTFHYPYSAGDVVTLRKNGVVLNSRNISLPLCITYLQSHGDFRESRFKKTVEDIEKSAINSNISSEMVMNKYKEYKFLEKKYKSSNKAIIKLLERN